MGRKSLNAPRIGYASIDKVLCRALGVSRLLEEYQACARLHSGVVAKAIADCVHHDSSIAGPAHRAVFGSVTMPSVEALSLDPEFVRDVARGFMRHHGVEQEQGGKHVA